MIEEIRIEDYSYDLPDDRIAKYPLPERDGSKLLKYSEGVVEIPSDCRTYYANKGVSHYYNEDSKYSNIILPSTTETVSSSRFCAIP